eukprot:GILK01009134.1.p1 GENE.GILK01009134.1~~GILK01009134.1.p1  ORF type:complete len:651 (+),score=119.27 GILK01009134.1:272-1954(+)
MEEYVKATESMRVQYSELAEKHAALEQENATLHRHVEVQKGTVERLVTENTSVHDQLKIQYQKAENLSRENTRLAADLRERKRAAAEMGVQETFLSFTVDSLQHTSELFYQTPLKKALATPLKTGTSRAGDTSSDTPTDLLAHLQTNIKALAAAVSNDSISLPRTHGAAKLCDLLPSEFLAVLAACVVDIDSILSDSNQDPTRKALFGDDREPVPDKADAAASPAASATIMQLEKDKHRLETKLQLYRQQIDVLTKENLEGQAKIDAQLKSIQHLKEEKDALCENLKASLASALEHNQDSLSSHLQGRLEAVTQDLELMAREKAQLITIVRQKEEFEKDRERLRVALDEKCAEVLRLQEQLATVSTEHTSDAPAQPGSSEQMASLMADNGTLRSQLRDAESERDRLQLEVQQLRTHIDSLSQQVKAADSKIQRLQSEQESQAHIARTKSNPKPIYLPLATSLSSQEPHRMAREATHLFPAAGLPSANAVVIDMSSMSPHASTSTGHITEHSSSSPPTHLSASSHTTHTTAPSSSTKLLSDLMSLLFGRWREERPRESFAV